MLANDLLNKRFSYVVDSNSVDDVAINTPTPFCALIFEKAMMSKPITKLNEEIFYAAN